MFKVIDKFTGKATKPGTVEMCREFINYMVKMWHARPQDFEIVEVAA